jgi:hypothetical protein
MKKNRGCSRKKKHAILEIECICNGNKKCDICNGRNIIALKECPAKMNNASVNRFLPFFWHWKATNYMQFPDGGGRYNQPSTLLEAFAMCAGLSNKQEQKEAEKARNK